MPSAYQRRTYDNSQHTGRMGDLIRMQGAVRADATQQGGQNSARMWQNIGQTVQGTMGELVRQVEDLPRQRAAKQAETDATAARDKQAKMRKALAESIDPATGRLDFGAAAKKIGEIDPVEAENWWQKDAAQKAEALQRDGEKAKELAKRLGIVLLSAEKDQAAGPGALQSAPVAYRSARESAIKDGLLEPDELPEEFDQAVVEQEVLQVMTAEHIFQQLWAKKPANVEYTLGPGQKRFGPDGRVIAAVPPSPSATAEAPYTLSPGQKRFGADGRVVASVPDRPPSSGGGGAGNVNAVRDDLRAAEQWKQRALADAEKKFSEVYFSGQSPDTPANAKALREHEAAKAEIQKSYLVQLGQSPDGPVRPPDQRDATMGDLTRPPVPPPALPSAPSSPLGATPAAAQPPAAQPRMVRMRAPNGEMALVPESQVQAALKAGAVVVK